MKILSEFPAKPSPTPTKQTKELIERRKITVAKRPIRKYGKKTS